jgi:hypothetical protein
MKKKHLMFLVGLAVTAVALWYSTRQVRLQDFLGELKHFRSLWLIPALLTFYYSMYLRAIRWGLLFRPHHQLKGYQVFRPMMVCFGFNSIFPARVGEFWRAYYVGRHENTGIPTALATVLAERILDAMTLLGMLGFSLRMLPPIAQFSPIELWNVKVDAEKFNAATRMVVIGSIGLMVCMITFMIPWTQRTMAWMIQRMPLSARIKEKLTGLLNQFARGFHALQQPWALAQIVFHSLALWLLIGVSNLMLAKGFGLAMNLAQAVALMTLIAIFITIPAAPGYWGLFEVGAIFSLIVLGVLSPAARSQALAYALTVHLVQYVPIVVMGLIFAWQLQARPVTEAIPEEEPAAKVSVKI